MPSPPRLIYLVGGYRETRPHARCWGWYDTPEECVARMNRDKMFFEGRYYSYGLVEAYAYGDFLPVSSETRWYAPVYAKGAKYVQESVEPCDPPESSKGVVGFLL